MNQLSRRRFLQGALAATAAGAGGWPSLEALGAAAAPQRGGRLVGTLPFANGGKPTFGELSGEATAGRRLLDLSTLDAASLVTPGERHFIHTRVPAYLPPTPSWQVSVRQPYQAPAVHWLKDLTALAEPQGVHLCECIENGADNQFGLISATDWKGISLAKLFTFAGRPEADDWMLLIEGFDRHAESRPNQEQGAGWIFSPQDLQATGAFLATEMNGQPLPAEQGYPLRLVVPGWFGFTWVKWVYSLVFLPEEAFATAHMKEYAAKSYQNGQPRRARAYAPSKLDGAAMPVRVEVWEVAGKRELRVVGIVWGGDRPPTKLYIRFHDGEEPVPVNGYERPASSQTWALWTHTWKPTAPGLHAISLRLDESSLRTRRLSEGHYRRTLEIEKVE